MKKLLLLLLFVPTQVFAYSPEDTVHTAQSILHEYGIEVSTDRIYIDEDKGNYYNYKDDYIHLNKYDLQMTEDSIHTDLVIVVHEFIHRWDPIVKERNGRDDIDCYEKYTDYLAKRFVIDYYLLAFSPEYYSYGYDLTGWDYSNITINGLKTLYTNFCRL